MEIKNKHGAMRVLRQTKGQGATEMLIVSAVLLIIFFIFLVNSQDTLVFTENSVQQSKAQATLDTLSNAINLLSSQGEGSRVTVNYELPDNVESFTMENRTISLKFTNRDSIYHRTTNINVTGTLPTAPGVYFSVAELRPTGINIFLSDTTPPSSITSLTSDAQSVTTIDWSWVNPTDADFDKNIVYLDGVEKTRTKNTFYNATELSSSTNYTITVHTIDTSGNINDTDVNSTAETNSPEGLTTTTIATFTQVCIAEDDANKGDFDDSCDGQYPNPCGDGDDLLRCSDDFQETHTALRSGKNYFYGGVKVDLYNTSVTNCVNITNVMLCYDWFREGLLDDCDISVDADGGGSFTAVTSSCPGTSAAGITCTNVTSTETWVCGNFFGATGTRGQIKSEGQRQGGPGTSTVSWDVLYFNVTYLRD